MSCYCGSGIQIELCCGKFLTGQKKPENAEQLMRSRYSAYCTKNAAYIFNTYAKVKQAENTIDAIQQWADETNWVKLVIYQAVFTSNTPIVEFSAYYVQDNQLFEIREYSRFILEDKQWRYLDGDILIHQQIQTLKRNDLCPCQSNKKFKKCCGNN